MALNYEFPQRLNLDKYDVYLEQPLNDTSYIFIDKLPRILYDYFEKQPKITNNFLEVK